MDVKQQIEAAKRLRDAKVSIEKGCRFHLMYLVIRCHVESILGAKYVADYEIEHIEMKSKYAAKRLSNLKRMVWESEK